MKRFAISVVWKTLHKSLPIKDALTLFFYNHRSRAAVT